MILTGKKEYLHGGSPLIEVGCYSSMRSFDLAPIDMFEFGLGNIACRWQITKLANTGGVVDSRIFLFKKPEYSDDLRADYLMAWRNYRIRKVRCGFLPWDPFQYQTTSTVGVNERLNSWAALNLLEKLDDKGSVMGIEMIKEAWSVELEKTQISVSTKIEYANGQDTRDTKMAPVLNELIDRAWRQRDDENIELLLQRLSIHGHDLLFHLSAVSYRGLSVADKSFLESIKTWFVDEGWKGQEYQLVIGSYSPGSVAKLRTLGGFSRLLKIAAIKSIEIIY